MNECKPNMHTFGLVGSGTAQKLGLVKFALIADNNMPLLAIAITENRYDNGPGGMARWAGSCPSLPVEVRSVCICGR